jgi:hypothetical protein
MSRVHVVWERRDEPGSASTETLDSAYIGPVLDRLAACKAAGLVVSYSVIPALPTSKGTKIKS